MDTDALRALLRAAILATPLAACGGAEPVRPVIHPDPVSQTDPPPAGTAGGSTEPPSTAGGAEGGAQASGGTMDPDEFERQWREGLGWGQESPPPPPIDQMIMEGRPLATARGPLLAPVVRGRGWSAANAVSDLPRVAARWLAAAQAEHASVASFARAVMELSAVGAPPELLEGHLRAGLDEVAHARLCFALAARFGAAHRAPGPLPAPPPRPASVAQLAEDTFLEGCMNETVAALLATRAAAGCEDDAARSALLTIAEDEARHAALAWQTVRWALTQDPVGVRRRLAGLALPLESGAAVEPTRTTDRGLRGYGLLDRAERARATQDALERVIVPLHRELLSL